MTPIKHALTIAGTDPTGGAGIQADLKTFQELHVYGMSVLTSIVAQNTMGVKDIHHLPIDFIELQLQSVIEDIYPHAIKTGMIAQKEMMALLATKLGSLQNVPYICDPVMMAKNGDPLLEKDVRSFLRDTLVPLATIVTPNIAEAEDLIDMKIDTLEDMKKAAERIIHELGAKYVVIKGGSLNGEATDVFYGKSREFHILDAPRTDTKHTHGTGCTFSAAITSELAKGVPIFEAVKKAKQFTAAAIAHSLNIGHGYGPTNHWAYRLTASSTQNE
ncbi:bifunctional hydroxymethylpyrimidine kinase/phosphomethylpyrimidine kinase [Shouchella lehensis]|uniref:Hydroxymethylpyrimidine/phosphomethylpyrimidine kinase n=1 Tax=Shouchella lehensis TaxID=300825 RepID=A0A4Y7WI71_9BACI|nr:bifunctional hydroxymethylpyrimidine kinase/phosphomethylpyrimidine kinase [Shouchella lehensis]MBG9785650.1 phosphomethylpyrimidine kinase [Shouchella lehensis]TES48110.1 bifunctional hydroxymethylpyrimidine kinase/phosphomethylpyrimidine kinase [Shouchella lehensis]